MKQVSVGRFESFVDGGCRVLKLGDLEVGVFRRGKRLIAWENRCPHYGGPVCQGSIFNRVEEVLAPDKTALTLKFAKNEHIVCPWHGYEYDLETGCHPGDASVRLSPVKVGVRDGEVFLTPPVRKGK
ncbi:MAG: Rieske (2Fe-2S) protein [Burkholderiales bacterium]